MWMLTIGRGAAHVGIAVSGTVVRSEVIFATTLARGAFHDDQEIVWKLVRWTRVMLIVKGC